MDDDPAASTTSGSTPLSSDVDQDLLELKVARFRVDLQFLVKQLQLHQTQQPQLFQSQPPQQQPQQPQQQQQHLVLHHSTCLREATSKVPHGNDKIDSLMPGLVERAGQTEVLRHEKLALESHLESLRSEVLNLSLEVRTLKLQRTDLETDKRKALEDAASARRETAALSNLTEAIRTQHVDLRGAIEAAALEKQEVDKQVKESKELADKLELELTDMQQQVEVLRQENLSLAACCKENEDRCNEVTATCASLRAERTSKASEVLQLKQQTTYLSEQVKAFSTEATQYQELADAARDDASSAQERIRALEISVHDTNAKNNALINELNSQRQERGKEAASACETEGEVSPITPMRGSPLATLSTLVVSSLLLRLRHWPHRLYPPPCALSASEIPR